jgi:hypothetical protein
MHFAAIMHFPAPRLARRTLDSRPMIAAKCMIAAEEEGRGRCTS